MHHVRTLLEEFLARVKFKILLKNIVPMYIFLARSVFSDMFLNYMSLYLPCTQLLLAIKAYKAKIKSSLIFSYLIYSMLQSRYYIALG